MPSLFHDDRKACAGLMDVVAEAERRDDRRSRSALGILLAPVARMDRVLEFLLSEGAFSARGDVTLSNECSARLPSGIVCGSTVRFSILSVLPVIAILMVGDVGEWRSSSYMCDVVDADVGNVGGEAREAFGHAVISVWITDCPSDG